MKPVVIPAATEMTSLSAVTSGPISSSSAVMSCGLTVISSVSARRGRLGRADHVDAVGLAQRQARSLRRTAAITSAGEQPARSRPEMSASPIFPAPRTAIISRSLP